MGAGGFSVCVCTVNMDVMFSGSDGVVVVVRPRGGQCSAIWLAAGGALSTNPGKKEEFALTGRGRWRSSAWSGSDLTFLMTDAVSGRISSHICVYIYKYIRVKESLGHEANVFHCVPTQRLHQNQEPGCKQPGEPQ